MFIGSMPVKIVCEKCGWHLIVKRYIPGIPNDLNIIKELLFNSVPECGECGSKSLSTSTPTLVEMISPIEYSRKLRYLGKMLKKMVRRTG